MNRHRGGDRYSDSDNDNDNYNYNTSSYNNTIDNQDSSYPNRRPSRFSDAPSRFSDSPINRYSDNGNSNNYTNYNLRSPNNYHGGGGGRRAFDSPPGGGVGGDGGFRPMGGGGDGGFRPMGGAGGGFVPNYQVPPPLSLPPQNISGRKRGFHGSSPDRFDGGGGRSGFAFAKLFVGSVPRTATEMDIRPLFEEHGNVIEVALIKDKRTGQQQGCCFIKYATSEEADRAIRALHNQRTLPGGVGPIQVRYADGERERLGAVEYKLFVGSLNKQATEKEVEEIFTPYGRVEDVYLMRDEMKQSRGCGFVKYSHRDMALAAINGLNGIYTMRGCEQPLTVRFADPKRPRPGGDSRGGPAFGSPGAGPRFQASGLRPPPNLGDPMGDHIPPNAWLPMSPQNMGPSSNAGVHGFGNQLPPRSGDLAMPLNQTVNQSLQHLPPASQQISPLQKPLQSPQHLPPSLQLHAQAASSYPQTQTSHVSQLQSSLATGQTPFSQALPSQHMIGFGRQLPASQTEIQQGISSTVALQAPHSMSVAINQQQLPAPVQQQLLQPLQQSPSQLAQMLSQQTQTLQASFQSSQQAFSQLQQQLQMMQPSNQSTLQQSPQAPRQQWPPQAVASTPLPVDLPPSTSAPTAGVMSQTVAPVKCNWTEHTSPEGFKYYYNGVTHESRWEKPEELKLFEQQQQLHQKPPVQLPQPQTNPQVLPTQQVPQTQQVHLQTQFRHQQQQPQPSFSSTEHGYTQLPAAASSVNDSTRFQGRPVAQDWMWRNKPAGT
ncbi:hypothetical protein POPTR_010G147900v4 [Populus trichocarpa]|uniref:Uncharacterized protein n=1 Tax=Populus trichocarpa TaxID=3694 RepID=A0ACC0SDI0_POPTR|nr:flowering time control protein FCA isoform X1 [Populus trichocarpa]KAI9387288.1 hypothetical protein POPTR_010G147900v4 [Populus trichocarpa]